MKIRIDTENLYRDSFDLWWEATVLVELQYDEPDLSVGLSGGWKLYHEEILELRCYNDGEQISCLDGREINAKYPSVLNNNNIQSAVKKYVAAHKDEIFDRADEQVAELATDRAIARWEARIDWLSNDVW